MARWGSFRVSNPGEQQFNPDSATGKNPFKGRGHRVAIVLLILGIIGILAVCIFIAIDNRRKSQAVVSDGGGDDGGDGGGAVTTPSGGGGGGGGGGVTDGRTTTRGVMSPLERLQGALQSSPDAMASNFTNWDETTFVPTVYKVVPSNLQEIQNVILAAKTLGWRIRAVGAGHSYSPIFPDEDTILLDMKDITTRHDGEPMEYIPNWAGGDQQAVVIAAGLTNSDLIDFCILNDVMIPTGPSIGVVTVGGMVSNAVHGSLFRQASFSSFVLAMRLVDANGELRSFNGSDPELAALRCCVGMCGVIYDVTLAVEPLITTQVTQNFNMSAEETLGSVEFLSNMTAAGGLQTIWAPLSSVSAEGWTSYQATGQIPASYDPWNDKIWYRWWHDPSAEDEEAEGSADGAAGRRRRSADLPPLITGSVPGQTTHDELLQRKYAFDYAYGLVMANQEIVGPLPDVNVFYRDPPPEISHAYSFALREDEQFSITRQVYEICFGLIKEYLAQNPSVLPIVTIETRWNAYTAACHLCPGGPPREEGRDAGHVLMMDVIPGPHSTTYKDFLVRLLANLKESFPNVQPLWSKFYADVNGTMATMKANYAEGLDAVNQIRRDSNLDPSDMFVNDILEGILQDS